MYRFLTGIPIRLWSIKMFVIKWVHVPFLRRGVSYD